MPLHTRDVYALRAEYIQRRKVKPMPFNPFSAITAKLFGGVALALLLAFMVQTGRIEGFLWIEGFKQAVARLTHDNAVIRVNLDMLKTANEIATERAQEAKRLADAKAAKQKELSDERLSKERSRYRELAARYAAANRVRAKAGETDSGSASGADLSSTQAATQGADGTSADAEFLAVSRSDFDIMVDNTVRLKEAVEWATGQ